MVVAPGSMLDMNGVGFVSKLALMVGVLPDKVTHFIMCFFGVPLLWLAVHPKNSFEVVCVLSFGVLFAFASEGVQYYLPYRSSEWGDIWADFFGSVLGMPLLLLSKFVYGSIGRW